MIKNSIRKEGENTFDFLQIRHEEVRDHEIAVYPDFHNIPSKDLMVINHEFYAYWDEENSIWSYNEYEFIQKIDEALAKERDKIREQPRHRNDIVYAVPVSASSSKSWNEYCKYKKTTPRIWNQLDMKLAWKNTKLKREDFCSRRLDYDLAPGDWSAFDKLIGTLYSPEEREKLEWAIGAIVTGKAKDIQKFIVLFGDAGTGKSTMLNIIEDLFTSYVAHFSSQQLVGGGNEFATGVFKSGPLVGIQHDGDLSKIKDNSLLNSIVSHETIPVNEKYEKAVPMRINAFLFVGTNRPVSITEGKSGLRRRLIDVRPTGTTLETDEYETLMMKIHEQRGAIAWHCKEVFEELGANYYKKYNPVDMMLRTNDIFNFVSEKYFQYKEDNGVSLKSAWGDYQLFIQDSGIERKLNKYKFRDELRNYFEGMKDPYYIDGKQVRSYYIGFKSEMFLTDKAKDEKKKEKKKDEEITLTQTTSLLDDIYKDCKAQYANEDGKPIKKWEFVETTLKDLDTTRLHYVQPIDIHHVVMDFDLKDEKGEKSKELNLKEAAKWPKTYMEFSKGGGVHSHYIYDGDPLTLSRIVKDGVECKVFPGDSSLRRKLSFCNDIPIAHLKEGSLPLKEEKVRSFEGFKNEKMLRAVIKKHLRKEIVGYTKPSIDLIFDCLEEAYKSGIPYDVTDLRPAITAFATNSSNNADYCLKVVMNMKFKSEKEGKMQGTFEDDRIMFFDIEVFPNLLLICYKFEGPDEPITRMYNPAPHEVEWLITNFKLVGFNNRRYDNHILYARMLGKSNEELYQLSRRLIAGSDNATFTEAYNLSYTDVYDFSAAVNKKSLKKWEFELEINHIESEHPWDEPLDEKYWQEVGDYCCNDVLATEAVFHHLKGDWMAREALADIAGGTVNTTTNTLACKFVFQGNKHPQDQFIYTDLSTVFPGYRFDMKGIPKEEYNPGAKIVSGKSIYMGMDPSEGGFVYAKPGMYYDVVLLDIASMHPSTIIALKLFGELYTKRYADIWQARIYVKHGDVENASKILDGALIPYLKDENTMKALSLALKTVLNSFYGLTAAGFENPARDPRNVDNIVAKRGGLFMIKLLHEVEARGYTVVHIKTDSIKIANSGTANNYDVPDIVKFVMDFGKQYGYTFEHEATYDRMCLVNDAVYIAKYDHEGLRAEKEKDKHRDEWTATGEQFARPFVFKSLFSREKIGFNDCREIFNVTSALYLDMNEGMEDTEPMEKELKKLKKVFNNIPEGDPSKEAVQSRIDILTDTIAKNHDYRFVGRVGQFTPVVDGAGGGKLVRLKEKGVYTSASGAKDYRWMNSGMVKQLQMEDQIDISYYRKLVDDAIEAISKHGDFEAFIAGDYTPVLDIPPWNVPCGSSQYQTCIDCPKCHKVDADNWVCDDKYKILGR